ncbi:kinase-like protein [Apiospora arundinis]|uniref:Kinase-like protein n=1 Tax=Apiospora arundinis TaxID=335852 RepID=A0ABR2HPC4_9PEZI
MSSEDSEGSYDSLGSEATEAIKARLIGYFAAYEDTFKFERLLGAGVAANAWRVRCRRRTGDPWARIVLKTPTGVGLAEVTEGNLGASVVEFQNERRLLSELRTRHLVRLINFSDEEDPLAQTEPRNTIGSWIYLEYLENGTLAQLVEKCDDNDVEYIPNRLLWRIFLCLVRACVAMAYIPDGPPANRYDENEEPCTLAQGSVSYSHNDMHSENVMIGDLLGDPDDLEHLICPVVKFIDLESHNEYAGGEGMGVQRNLLNIGANMAEIILRSGVLGIDICGAAESDDGVWFEPGGGYDGFSTAAKELLVRGANGRLPQPELDPDLRRLVCECTAINPRQRPRLASDLLPTVLEAVEDRDAAYYGRAGYCDARVETDEAILGWVQRVLGAVPAPPSTAGDSDEEDNLQVGGEGPESLEVYTPTGTRRFTARDSREASPESLPEDPRERYRKRDD